MSQQSQDPERLIPQQPEDLHADAMQGKRKCHRSGHDLAPRHQARDLALPRRLREQRERCYVLVLRLSVLRADRRNKLRVTLFASSWNNLVPIYRTAEWRYEFKISSLTSRILNLLFGEVEQKGRTRHFHMYVGPGSDGSSAHKLSFNLKFNPQDTAISLRSKRQPMTKTVFTQYNFSESWCTEQRSAR